MVIGCVNQVDGSANVDTFILSSKILVMLFFKQPSTETGNLDEGDSTTKEPIVIHKLTAMPMQTPINVAYKGK